MANAEVRLLAGDCALDENGHLVSGTPVGNIVIPLEPPDDTYPPSLFKSGEDFYLSFPGRGTVLAAYTRLEGKTNVSNASVVPYSETASVSPA